MYTKQKVLQLVASMTEKEFVRKHTRTQLEEMYHALYGHYPLVPGKKQDIADCIFDYIQRVEREAAAK